MTCEIAILNQSAVVLAADSAMTVRRWVNGEQETRYFKGSNKIFQLSNHHPVGLMVYGSASIQGVPWELIIKEFRGHLKSTSYQSLKGYTEGLFDYIRQHPTLFTPVRRDMLFIQEVANTGLAVLFKMIKAIGLEQEPKNVAEKKKVIDDYLNREIAALLAEPLPNVFAQDTDKKTLAIHQAKVSSKMIENVTWAKDNGRVHADRQIDEVLLGKLTIHTLYRKYSKLMSSSGIVVAGFGDMDIYPAFHEQSCFGFLLDDFLFDEVSGEPISDLRTSYIKPFATTSMVDTFLLGFSDDVHMHVMKKFRGAVNSLIEEAKKELKATNIPNIDTHILKAEQEYQAAWTQAVADDHLKPLREVVASLPIDEMASLAATLVMLQSLKEKVTLPTESVGGPIDVAVITKHEGLIWIKRKHYFDAEKNPRYFLRQKANAGS